MDWGIEIRHPNGAVTHLPPGAELDDEHLQDTHEVAELVVCLLNDRAGRGFQSSLLPGSVYPVPTTPNIRTQMLSIRRGLLTRRLWNLGDLELRLC